MIDIIAEHIRRAAHGRHRCGLCHKMIPARSRYSDQRCAEDGHVWTWRTHLVCLEFMRRASNEAEWILDEWSHVEFNELVIECPDLAAEMGVWP